jgi:hypothetical protein
MTSASTDSLDGFFRDWSQTWQRLEAAQPAPQLALTVRRGTWQLYATMGVEVLLAVAFVGLSLWWTRHWVTGERLACIAAVGAFTVLALGFSIWNRLGLWRPLSESTAGFIELATERCRARMLNAKFSIVLLVAEVIFVLTWFLTTTGASQMRAVLALLLPMCAAFGLWAVLHHGRAKLELARLQALRRELLGS